MMRCKNLTSYFLINNKIKMIGCKKLTKLLCCTILELLSQVCIDDINKISPYTSEVLGLKYARDLSRLRT